ncbi:MAG: hypothetical protein FJ135_11835 [Deltaproteobacteria bacterium]|nr:hypothetical protein [Deltaproteobacteria bacterium]
MSSALLGALGVGLVWGWLLGMNEGRIFRGWRTVPGLALTSLILAAPIVWFQGILGLAGFGGAAFLAWWLHVEWRQTLRQRFSVTDAHEGERS